MANHLFFVFILSVIISIAYCADIDADFRQWMSKNLKPDDAKRVIRDELDYGSYGGGKYKQDVRPVVQVHGMNNNAAYVAAVRRRMAALGFPKEALFGTTWGNGNTQLNLMETMKCEYVQQIRRHIEVVLMYTKAKQIDVIGYSLGAPMARKAILGGKCVDNGGVDIGKPLTDRIHTFISIAGANQGSMHCGIPWPGICNQVNGLSCNSQFLRDINSKSNYESTFRSYNLASTADQIVGYFACGRRASDFTGAHEWKLDGRNHDQTEFETAEIQIKMLKEGNKKPEEKPTPKAAPKKEKKPKSKRATDDKNKKKEDKPKDKKQKNKKNERKKERQQNKKNDKKG